MVSGLKGRSFLDKLKEVNLTTLEERRVRGDMIQTFRIVQGLDNVEMGTWFKFANEREREGAVNTRLNRDTTRLVEMESRYENRRNFFSQRVPSKWNTLPESTRQQTTVLNFKAAYDGTIVRHTGQP